jgi:hypothetical protein
MRFTKLAAVTIAAAAAVITLTLAQQGAAEDAKPEYVGDKACQKCHFQQYKSWKKTSMANAMKALMPTTEADNKALFDKKTAAKLDPAKDYTTDEKCVKCHTTGYGEPGGYPKDPKKDEAAAKAAAAMNVVGCESCHGPGSLYVKHKTEEVEKNKDAKFKWEDLAKFGLIKPDESVCAKCHNDQAPTKPAEPFKFDDAKAKVHDHPKK